MTRDPSRRLLAGERASLWDLGRSGGPPESRSEPERLRAVWQDGWVEHGALIRAQEAMLSRFGHVRFRPDGRPVALPAGRRSQGVLLVSRAGNGASAFMTRFVEHARTRLQTRIVMVRMPVGCASIDVLKTLRKALGAHGDRGEPGYSHEFRLLDELRWHKIRAIVIDDAGHLLGVSRRRRDLEVASLRSIAKKADVRLILVAPPRLAAQLCDLDPEVTESGSMLELIAHEAAQPFLPVTLPRFRVDEDFIWALDRWESSLPLLRASNLTTRDLALHLFALSDGNHGKLASVLRRAAEAAILDGSERITIGLLDLLGLEPPHSFRGFRF